MKMDKQKDDQTDHKMSNSRKNSGTVSVINSQKKLRPNLYLAAFTCAKG